MANPWPKIKLELPDSEKGPQIKPCSEKWIAILVTIFIIVYRTKHIFKHGREIEDSNAYVN